MREKLYILLNDPSTPGGQRVALVVQTLILYSLITIPFETVETLPPAARDFLLISEWAILIVFSIEYLLRLWCHPKPWKYALSWWGFVDLIAILPSLLFATGEFRALRAFRLMRVFRVLKLGRFSAAMQRLGIALRSVLDEIAVFGLMSLIILYLASLGIHYFEKDAQPEAFATAFDGMWWAIVTLTTVGYGDVYPVTVGGKLFTVFILIIGLGIVAVPTALVAAALTSVPDQDLQPPPDSVKKPPEVDGPD